MSEDVVIRLDKVSKRYKRIFYTLRHRVQERVNQLFGRNERFGQRDRYLWALNDVSFEVRRGEILGIIGINGAGKSTILKLISRISHPTSGRVDVNGRVGALIEIGAGFHPELTGHENVYLNGSILGMSRKEVKSKYNDIVDFAELDGFMDMPVKYYSTGMYVRLGFAVAAHQEPEIFLIDDVLAVGDAAFQAKCIKKVHKLKERGTTIILVSHNMDNIAKYSDRVLWLDWGHVRMTGSPGKVTQAYLESTVDGSSG
jgi:lipopolysaccharide transport system ATP-binding protein